MKILKALFYLAAIGCLGSAAWLFYCSARLVQTADRELTGIREEARELTQVEAQKSRDFLSEELEQLENRAQGELELFIMETSGKIDRGLDEIHEIAVMADNRLESMQKDFIMEARELKSDLMARADIALEPINKSLAAFETAIYETVVCYDEELGLPNPSCFSNKAIGAMQAFEEMSENFADLTKLAKDSAPAIVEDFHKTAGHFANIAENADKAVDSYVNPPWYKKVINIAVAVAAAAYSVVK